MILGGERAGRRDARRALRSPNGRGARVDAERRLRAWARATGVRASVLRVPGIYALDREGGRPQTRLLHGTPALRPEDDVVTSHIHADDLARACLAALWRRRPHRVVKSWRDASEMLAGDWYDLRRQDHRAAAAQARIARAEAHAWLTPGQRSFLEESRRLSDERMRRELRVTLRHPTVRECLLADRERRAAPR